jgi:hypothetical protein
MLAVGSGATITAEHELAARLQRLHYESGCMAHGGIKVLQCIQQRGLFSQVV